MATTAQTYLLPSCFFIPIPKRGILIGPAHVFYGGFPGGSAVKNPPADAGDLGSISGSGRSPGEGDGNSHQYSCLENSMDRGAWRATVHGGAKSQTPLSNFTFFLSIVPFGKGNDNPLQCSCLENPMDRGAWCTTVYGVAKSRTRLSN